jgi:hypothetical protein
MKSPRRIAASALVAFAFVSFACSNDELPSKAEFVDEMRVQAGAQFEQAMADVGLDEATSEQIFDEFAGCVYDRVADNEELLNSVLDEEGDASFDQVMEEKAADCVTAFQADMEEAVLGDAGL